MTNPTATVSPPPPPAKWAQRLTVQPLRRGRAPPVAAATKRRSAAVVRASQASAATREAAKAAPVPPSSAATSTATTTTAAPAPPLRTCVEAVLQTAWSASSATGVRTQVHTLAPYAVLAAPASTPSVRTFHARTLLQLATLRYLDVRSGGAFTAAEATQVQAALLSESAVARYTETMGLARVCPSAAHDRSTAPFEAFVGAYYADQRAAATGIRDALPIATTLPHSPLHNLFHTYSPDAQAVAAVDALVAAVLDRCWCRFFRVDAVTAVELRSLVHTAGGDPKAALNARFHVRFNSAPVWEYGMTQTGQHTCTVRHLDGVVLGIGEGATREEAERWAAEGVGVV